MSARREVIVFAKAPTPGSVKTRLIGALTPEDAAEVYLRCLRLTVQAASAVGGVRVVLSVRPDDWDGREIGDSTIERRPQGPGDLGERLGRAVCRAFGEALGGEEPALSTAAPRILLVGSDSPTMTTGDLRAAFELLERFDAVIGPATDGGYYLLGLRRPVTVLFENIEWSSPRVLSQTMRRAAEAGLSIATLPQRRDIDEPDDLIALVRELDDVDARLADFGSFLRSLQLKRSET